MASDQAKNAGAVAQEHHMPPYQPYGAYSQPFPVYYDPSHPEPNGGPHPAPPYIYHYPPPGMMYPYPPPGFPPYAPPPQTNFQRVKRKQVKMACTNCANACKRCDEQRPCERCVKYGIPESCIDGVRKERQKGIKRGPYKRKNKSGNSDPATSPTPNATFETFSSTPPEANGDPVWHPPSVAQGPATTAPAPPSMSSFPPPPEGGYYPPPYFYPAPPGFVPPSEGQAPAEGSPNAGAPPAMVPYYMPPPGYYGPPYYGPPGVPPPTMDPAQAELQRTSGHSGDPDPDVEEIPPPAPKTTSKKRSRVGKDGQPKVKKFKSAAVVQESSTSSGTTGGSDQASEPGHGSPAENGDA
ncbi:uncharacterized protein EDB91DRAFT_876156 [Suillus paluster]|uniref:uncharacterized protein n=1 Tax=Suillus paluster TaxID=48578 RepID=UPI001B86A7B5|nr:uncharacterized protein EDB91DRAFT_876156 [Suillus paluster]KAG1748354.1 hypothetical protein EDB91DRAFT_876156 [Suillus paluster]